MATQPIPNILRIRVLEDSPESGIFVVSACCAEPLLLRFWARKGPFRNGQVEQAAVSWQNEASLDFVLRVLHRAPNVANGDYWGPFVLALCLDALPFRFRLPGQVLSGGHMQDIIGERGELTLYR